MEKIIASHSIHAPRDTHSSDQHTRSSDQHTRSSDQHGNQESTTMVVPSKVENHVVCGSKQALDKETMIKVIDEIFTLKRQLDEISKQKSSLQKLLDLRKDQLLNIMEKHNLETVKRNDTLFSRINTRRPPDCKQLINLITGSRR